MKDVIMNRLVIATVTLAVLIALTLSLRVSAGAARPSAIYPASFNDQIGPSDICTEEQLAKFDPASMMSDIESAVHPLGVTDRSVSAVIIDLPKGSCIGLHTHIDANVMYVRDGSIRYVAYEFTPEFGTPVPGIEVWRGQSNGNDLMSSTLIGTPISLDPVPFGTPIELSSGAWITQNGIVWHSYENIGSAPAVIVIASYSDDPTVSPTPGPGGCHGGCIGRGP
jgi:hypothetical protein